jgi:hypothetical protein
MLCGLVPPIFPLTVLIDPFLLLAGGVVGFDESRRSILDRADWLAASGNMMGDQLMIRDDRFTALGGGCNT